MPHHRKYPAADAPNQALGAFVHKTPASVIGPRIASLRASASFRKARDILDAMTGADTFWKLDGLSDRELVERLSTALGSGRQLTAELVAHLGEVEARRLHLQAACSSMFQYCVTKLRLSEDEACRRIEVARLARRFPEIFPLRASGALSLSIVAVLKHNLSAENASELLALVRGQTLQRAREIVAALPFTRAGAGKPSSPHACRIGCSGVPACMTSTLFRLALRSPQCGPFNVPAGA